MPVRSAGILLFRRRPGIEFFLIHPGGPCWRGKDEGAWSIPKGLVAQGEGPFAAARREFQEETGVALAGASAQSLGNFKLPSGNQLSVWAIEGDCDPDAIRSNSFELIWPPRSSTLRRFPEADKAGWFDPGGHA